MENLTFFVFAADLKAVFDACKVLTSESLGRKKQDLRTESHQKKRKVQHDLEKRHILIDKINIVSGRIPDLKLIISGALVPLPT